MARLGACKDATEILKKLGIPPQDWMEEALETKEEHRP